MLGLSRLYMFVQTFNKKYNIRTLHWTKSNPFDLFNFKNVTLFHLNDHESSSFISLKKLYTRFDMSLVQLIWHSITTQVYIGTNIKH